MIRIMPHLTVNQAMVLLDIYRGTLNHFRHLDTMNHDLRMLHEKEYIQGEAGIYSTTISGEERVKHMLN